MCRAPPVRTRLLASYVMATDPAESAVRNYLASLSAPDTFRQGFIEHAKAWAEAQDIPPEAFEQMGVPADVLREAGIVEGRPGLATPTPPDVTGHPSDERDGSIGEPVARADVGRVVRHAAPRKAAVRGLEGQENILPYRDRTGGGRRPSQMRTASVTTHNAIRHEDCAASLIRYGNNLSGDRRPQLPHVPQ